ncbi:hypothetical protein DL93DRAFT_2233241 [Clavulina sp. PMI_390]|nr:hypothetical protein DL93DRAFT_2233241 [Clavulina sp. PMI_390]
MLTSTLPLIPVLILSIISFTASGFVILRTLLPLVPAHPLNHRVPSTAYGVAKPALSPAKKATLYIAAFDFIALVALLWQAVVEAIGTSANPSSNAGTAARLWIAMTARQTCLLVVATLTILYVRSDKTLTFGSKDSYVWAPSGVLVLASTACAAAFTATHHVDLFYSAAIIYTTIVAVASTGCFGGFLAYILILKQNLSTRVATQANEWPTLKSQTKMYQPRRAASFASADVDRLREGSSWLTSIHSDHTHSTDAFSFDEDAQSVAAPSTRNPYSGSSVPGAKSPFWFGMHSNANLEHQEKHIEEGIPSTPAPEHEATDRSLSRASATTFGYGAMGDRSSWLTEPTNAPSSPTKWSFPSYMKSRPNSGAEAFHGADIEKMDYRQQMPMETPFTATAFSPSPRTSGEIRCYLNGGIDGYRPDSAATLVKPQTPFDPRTTIGGAAAYERGSVMESVGIYGEENRFASGNLEPWRMAGWFISIWLPFILALPYLCMSLASNANPSSPPAWAGSNVPLVLLTLSITLSSPIMALQVLFSSSPIPYLPSAVLAAAGPSGRLSLIGNIVDRTVSSSVFGLPADMVEHNPSKVTMHERRSGDVWIRNGHARDDGKGKLSRAMSVATPIPRLACLDPVAQSERTSRNPTPEPRFAPKHRYSKSEPDLSHFVYEADPIIEAATRILAEQAAQKAEIARASIALLLSSDVASFGQSTGASSYVTQEGDSELTELGQQAQARVMVAQRQFPTVAVANTITIPPASSRSGSPSDLVTPGVQIDGFAPYQEDVFARSLKHALEQVRSKSELEISGASRSSVGSAQKCAGPTSSLPLTPKMSLAGLPTTALPSTPPTVKVIPQQPQNANLASDAEDDSFASIDSADLPSLNEDDTINLGSVIVNSAEQDRASVVDESFSFSPDNAFPSDVETSSEFKFGGFNALDEEEVEAILASGAGSRGPIPPPNAREALAPLEPTAMSTPKKISGSGMKSMAKMSSKNSVAEFSSPEVHSTPNTKKAFADKQSWRKRHMSLPSLDLGKRGNHLKNEITTTLAGDENRSRTTYDSEASPTLRRVATPPLVINVHKTVITYTDAAIPMPSAARKSPTRSSTTGEPLTIAERYARSLAVDQLDLNPRTAEAELAHQIEAHMEAQETASAPRTRATTLFSTYSAASSAYSLAPTLLPESRTAVSSTTTLAAAWSLGATKSNDNKNARSSPRPSRLPLPLSSSSKASKVAGGKGPLSRSLPPLSLLQGLDYAVDAYPPAQVANKRANSTTPKSAKTKIPKSTRSVGGRHGRQDENQDIGPTMHAATKARGVPRRSEPLPRVFGRPSSGVY